MLYKNMFTMMAIVALILGLGLTGLSTVTSQAAEQVGEPDLTELLADNITADAKFGTSVDADGTSIVVGAPDDNADGERSGSAHVFTVNENGVPSNPVKLLPQDPDAGDTFGRSVGISGNTIIVGARFEDDDTIAQDDRGAAYVFVRNNSDQWQQQAKLIASDAGTGDNFGSSVAIVGDIAVIGADRHNGSRGAAYIFTRSAQNEWSQASKLTGDDTAPNDRLGSSVAIDGTTVVVGAPFANAGSGASYVFTPDGAPENAWSQQDELEAPNLGTFAVFGSSVAVSSNTALVGAPGSNNFSGAVYAFTKGNGAVWSFQQTLLAENADNDDFFGNSVALNGNTALIGADGDDDNGIDSGTTYFFVRTGDTWNQQVKVGSPNPVAGEGQDIATALSGELGILGFPRAGEAGESYLYKIDITPPSIVELAPSGGSTDPNSDLSILFNEEVQAVDGSIVITQVGGDVVEIIDVTSGIVVVDGAQVTINPTSLLNYGVSYDIDIEGGAFADLSGNVYAGFNISP